MGQLSNDDSNGKEKQRKQSKSIKFEWRIMYYIRGISRLFLLHRPKQFVRYYAVKADAQECASSKCANVEEVLMQELKIPKHKLNDTLAKYPATRNIKPEELQRTVNTLQSLSFSTFDISSHLNLLVLSSCHVKNMYLCLREFGFKHISTRMLTNYNDIVSKSVRYNKCFNFLPKELNVIEHIFRMIQFQVNDSTLLDYDETLPLSTVQQLAIQIYLMQRLNISEDHVQKILTSYKRLKRRSLTNLSECINLWEFDIGVSHERLAAGYLFLNYPETLYRLIEIKDMFAIDIYPLLSTSNTTVKIENAYRILQHMQSFGVPKYALQNEKNIFQMQSEEVLANLQFLQKFNDNGYLFIHPAILKLVQNMENIRKEIKESGADFNQVFDLHLIELFLNNCLSNVKLLSRFLSEVLNTSETEITQRISMHPYYNKVTINAVVKTYIFLKQRNFTTDDILQFLYIVLYPESKIHDYLDRLESLIASENININSTTLSNSQKLRACVYFIEREYNFTGDGVYSDSGALSYNDDDYIEIQQLISKALKNKSNKKE